MNMLAIILGMITAGGVVLRVSRETFGHSDPFIGSEWTVTAAMRVTYMTIIMVLSMALIIVGGHGLQLE
jgi:hypothetical protein